MYKKFKRVLSLLLACTIINTTIIEVAASENNLNTNNFVNSRVRDPNLIGQVGIANTSDTVANKLANEIVPNAVDDILETFPALEKALGTDKMETWLQLYNNPNSSVAASSMAVYRDSSLGAKPTSLQINVNTKDLKDEESLETGRTSDDLKSTIVHEIMHLIMQYTMPDVMDKNRGKQLPKWFYEGIAQVAGGGFTNKWNGWLINPSVGMQFDIWDGEDAVRKWTLYEDKYGAYAQGYLAVMYLGYKASDDKQISATSIASGVNKILESVIDGDSFDEALRKNTGMSQKDIEGLFGNQNRDPKIRELGQFTQKLSDIVLARNDSKKGAGAVVGGDLKNTGGQIIKKGKLTTSPFYIGKMNIHGKVIDLYDPTQNKIPSTNIEFKDNYMPSKIYDGQPLKTPTIDQIEIENADFNKIKFVWIDSKGTEIEEPKESGTYTLKATVVGKYGTKIITKGNITITPKQISVIANNKTKNYGEPDPIFTYEVDSEDDRKLLSGNLSRAEGEDVGIYDIVEGDLTVTDTKNYTLNFTKGTLNINKSEVNLEIDLSHTSARVGDDISVKVTAKNLNENLVSGATQPKGVKVLVDNKNLDLNDDGDGNWTGTYTILEDKKDVEEIQFVASVDDISENYNNPNDITTELTILKEGSTTKEPVKINIKSDNKNITYGDVVDYIISVNSIENESKPTGNVKVYLDSDMQNEIATGLAEDGFDLTLDTSKLTAGEHNIIIKYEGDSNFSEVEKDYKMKVSKKQLAWNIEDLIATKESNNLNEADVIGTLKVDGIINNEVIFKQPLIMTKGFKGINKVGKHRVEVVPKEGKWDSSFVGNNENYILPIDNPCIFATVTGVEEILPDEDINNDNYNHKPLPIQPSEIGNDKEVRIQNGLVKVPDTLKGYEKFNTVEKIEQIMKQSITDVSDNNTLITEVTLCRKNGGKREQLTLPSDFPKNGKLTLTIPYPEGTNKNFIFKVVHMITMDGFGKKPGEIEIPEVTNTENGIQFIVQGLSPILISWTDPSEPSNNNDNNNSSNNNSNNNQENINDNKYEYKGNSAIIGIAENEEISSKVNNAYDEVSKKDKTQIKDTPFIDVNDKHWFNTPVKYVYQNNLMFGIDDTKFDPQGLVTRAMAVTVIYRMSDSPKVNGKLTFSDVLNGQYYTNPIIWANDNNIVSGYEKNMFLPNNFITREELAVIFWNKAGKPNENLKELSFKDEDEVSNWARPAVEWAVSNGFIQGNGENLLKPKDVITRAELAQIIMVISEKYNK